MTAPLPLPPPAGPRSAGTGPLQPGQGGDGLLRPLLQARRSTKAFSDRPLALAEIASALWAVAGTTGPRRVTPSARASYPLAATLVSGEIDGLSAGAHSYDPATHALTTVHAGDPRPAVAGLTLDAPWVAACPAAILLSADLAAARTRFPDQPPEHGEHFVWIEVGHAAQNLYLWAADHGRGTVLLAGLDDERSAETAPRFLPHGHRLLGILPIGHPAD